jgi:hypothetical protein
MVKYIGKIAGYTVGIVVIGWAVLTAGPTLVDAASDGKVLAGAVLYILGITAIATLMVFIVKTVKQIRRDR